MKRTILILMALMPLLAFGQKGSYVIKLHSVEIDGASVGSIKIDSVKPAKLMTYVSNYADTLLEVTFNSSYSSINFDLLNKNKKTIKLIWNEAAYVDYDNTTSKVMHVGVKFIEKNNDQPSTSIIGGAKISDLASPTDKVKYTTGSYGGWSQSVLFPYSGKNDLLLLRGKKVKLLLPIQIGGKQIDYVFTFEILFNAYLK